MMKPKASSATVSAVQAVLATLKLGRMVSTGQTQNRRSKSLMSSAHTLVGFLLIRTEKRRKCSLVDRPYRVLVEQACWKGKFPVAEVRVGNTERHLENMVGNNGI
jgi:hypothetical protein